MASNHVTVHQLIQRVVRTQFEEEVDEIRVREIIDPLQQCILAEFASGDISKRTSGGGGEVGVGKGARARVRAWAGQGQRQGQGG